MFQGMVVSIDASSLHQPTKVILTVAFRATTNVFLRPSANPYLQSGYGETYSYYLVAILAHLPVECQGLVSGS